jgi:hypothetical protein
MCRFTPPRLFGSQYRIPWLVRRVQPEWTRITPSDERSCIRASNTADSTAIVLGSKKLCGIEKMATFETSEFVRNTLASRRNCTARAGWSRRIG